MDNTSEKDLVKIISENLTSAETISLNLNKAKELVRNNFLEEVMKKLNISEISQVQNSELEIKKEGYKEGDDYYRLVLLDEKPYFGLYNPSKKEYTPRIHTSISFAEPTRDYPYSIELKSLEEFEDFDSSRILKNVKKIQDETLTKVAKEIIEFMELF